MDLKRKNSCGSLLIEESDGADMALGVSSSSRYKCGAHFDSSRLWIICLFSFLFALFAPLNTAFAQDAGVEQQRLYDQMVQQPTNYDLTSAYVKIATDRGDFEAAIGALERLLFYNPNLGQVKYELGVLYYRLGSFEMAKRYFREALADGNLDAATKARIEANLANADKQTQPSRLSVFAQTGVRYQTNASYAPSSGVVRFEGADYGLLPSQGLQSDGNAFQLFGISHDYDLQNETGIVLETRVTGYATEQFHLTDLDVALFDGSLGPRIPLALNTLPGVTIKPYVAGGDVLLGGSPYFASVGGGVSMGIPVSPRLSFEPNVEARNVNINTVDPLLSGFNSGTWFGGGVSSSYIFNDQVKADARAYYRRGTAANSFQAFNQWIGEVALPYQFAPPLASIPISWMVSPFGRIIRTSFDAANPYIDPAIVRADTEFVAGVVLSTPITQNFGISTTIEFDYTDSTLTNYRQQNFSILTGPTARF
jgi:hypothetical protein